MRIFVCGMLAGDPYQAGATWAVLQYALGLRELGHDVYLVEPIAPDALRPSGALADSINARYFHDVAARFDLTMRAALLRQDTCETAGLSYVELLNAARGADLLINVSGLLTDPALFEAIPRRVYLDLDPAFNQLWHAIEGIDMRFDGHTHFVTVGAAIGTDDCNVVTCGRSWIHTWQPVVLSEWPATPGDARASWTTVGNWRGYGSITSSGMIYGQRAHSFRRFFELPQLVRETFEPALAIDPGETSDLEALSAHGWQLTDPASAARTPEAYRTFIQQSKGELGVAKSGYVVSRSGWFSDRSVCYLASGRPVVAQDTGFSRYLPVGEGLLAFDDVEGAAEAIEDVSRDYARHGRRARELAEAYFRSEVVLSTLLDRVGAADAGGSHASRAGLAL